jgi:quercetin dioxygenase-like cupin family protein
MRRPSSAFIFIIATVLIGATSFFAQSAETPIVRQISAMKFSTPPHTPKCIAAALDRGNPRKGPSVVFARLKPGCIVPWHWHPFNETLMTVGGTIESQVKGGATYRARRGDFLFLPARHAHRAICMGPDPCFSFLNSEGPTNPHWIDKSGREISLEAALKGK